MALSPLSPLNPLARRQPTQFNPVTSSVLNSAVPGLPSLTKSATDVVKSALSGLPSTSTSRLANAYFGAGSGLGAGSEFVRNRGFDLYGQQAEQRKNLGVQQLLAMLSGYSAPMLQERGQDIQQAEFGANLAQEDQQFADQFGLQREDYNRRNRPSHWGYVGGLSGGLNVNPINTAYNGGRGIRARATRTLY